MTHILIVEDDEQYCTMVSHMLMKEGYRVSVARNGDEGLRQAAAIGPDLILTDILMPGSDGIDLIMGLRQQGSGIPLIAMSGGRRSIRADFNLDSAHLLGVKTTLAKPFTREELRTAVRAALGQ